MNNNEREYRTLNGYIMLAITLSVLALGIIMIVSKQMVEVGFGCIAIFLFLTKGFFTLNPNEARVLLLFGAYRGTVKHNGFLWVNPFLIKYPISLRAMNLNGNVLKVNDSMGNPIEIAAVIVWQVSDTAKAMFAVDDFQRYVAIQSEAAVRHLAGAYPYDNIENNESSITLRNGGDKVSELLENELHSRLNTAGIKIIEARISHLAYAPEIASAMLQRQQATAVVAARRQIVDGAVSMVEMALAKLAESGIVELDNERKAIMVSNLLVVLCSEKSTSPVINTSA